MAVKDHLALQFVHILFDLIMLDHNDYQITAVDELIQVMHLVGNYILCNEGVIALKRSCQMMTLRSKKLKGRRLSHVIHVLFIGKAVQTNPTHISKSIFLHYLINTVQHEVRHAIIRFHGLVNYLCKGRVVTNQEPRVNGDAMPANARTRLQDIRALFFMGVNEGHIPRNTSQGGILTEGDRAFFASEGIELAPDPREQINIQRFYLYLNLTRPRDILQLSCCTTSGKGEAVTPAYLIGTIMSLFPLLEIKNAEKERLSSLPEEPLAAVPDFLRMLSMYSREDPDPLFGELYSWYLSEPAYTGRIRQLTELSLFRKGADRITREAAAALYGEVEKSGATRLERFASCAFAHFLRYGLRLQERVRYEFRPADMGTLMHTALERFSIELEKNDLTWDSLSDEERDRLILACLEDAAGDYGNSILESNANLQMEQILWNRTINSYLKARK